MIHPWNLRGRCMGFYTDFLVRECPELEGSSSRSIFMLTSGSPWCAVFYSKFDYYRYWDRLLLQKGEYWILRNRKWRNTAYAAAISAFFALPIEHAPTVSLLKHKKVEISVKSQRVHEFLQIWGEIPKGPWDRIRVKSQGIRDISKINIPVFHKYRFTIRSKRIYKE